MDFGYTSTDELLESFIRTDHKDRFQIFSQKATDQRDSNYSERLACLVL